MSQQRHRERIGGLDDYIVSYLFVIVFSIFAIFVMVKTQFNNRLRFILLSTTVLAFFFLKGGHLIPLITRLLGSEGVRAAAGEVGIQHVAKFSWPLTIVALALTLGLTYFIGRAICGYGCPVGALQEILYDVSTGRASKLVLPSKFSFFIRLGVFFMIIGLYLLFGLDIIQVIAPYQLWTMEVAVPGIVVMAAFFLASPFIYRPFCRLFCPYGVIAAFIARFSKLKLEKTDSCTGCGMCDISCPTRELDQKYGECYLCGRCFHVCSVSALEFIISK